MTNQDAVIDAGASSSQLGVRKIGVPDLIDALAKGLADFKEMPSHYFFLCVIYPIVIFFSVRLTFGYDVLPLLFPLIGGYALIGPLAATGLYELSRRREAGLEVNWAHAFDVFRSPSIAAIATLGVLLTAIFFAWLGAAWVIYEITFGGATPASVTDFARQIFTTSQGWALMVVGSGVGFLFAVVVLTVGVVSFPLLVDRDVGAMTAIQTSVRAVLANPVTMATWGLIVAGTLVIGALPLFVGLAIVWPVLGHASWHLYRKVVER